MYFGEMPTLTESSLLKFVFFFLFSSPGILNLLTLFSPPPRSNSDREIVHEEFGGRIGTVQTTPRKGLRE